MTNFVLNTLVLAACCALPHAALAADNTVSTQIDALEGVYKHRFKNGAYNGSSVPGKELDYFESEDVVEIVRHDDSHIYVRAELAFFNGHSCSIWGMAGYENGKFVYHDPEPALEAGKAACTLSVWSDGKKLHLDDRAGKEEEASCRSSCGARGSLSDYQVDVSAKHKIRYMDRLKASREYAEAVQALAKTSGKK